ncbi:hypothetical protein IKF20_02325 [Candidatus Saccharibacteria bacterium]|nr:hypothetical protein [Candidatus Saccharibacteria bacterium]
MQPDNLSNAINAVAPQGSSAQSPKPSGDLVFRDKPKKNTGMIVGMIILAMLAAGGIGFGVWAILDKNQEVANLNDRISQLSEEDEEENSEDEQQINDLDDNNTSSENPMITAQPPESYRAFYSLPLTVQSSENNTMSVSIDNDGKVSCSVSNLPNGGECSISGLPTGVYKMETIYEGNGSGTERIGFIMNDGSVWYASVYDNGNVNMNMQAKKMNIDGFVKDIVGVYYTQDANAPTGWYFSTVFVKDDNSFIKFNESML